MSFSVSISGHSSKPHNAAVQAAVEAAVEALKKVPGMNATVSGYTWAAGGQESRIDLAQAINVPE